jgi:hypothetical protein
MGDKKMSETTHTHPEDLLNMLQRSERLGAHKTLIWLTFQFKKDMIAQDIVQLVDLALAVTNEELYADFKEQHTLLTDLDDIIEKRKQQEKGEVEKE